MVMAGEEWAILRPGWLFRSSKSFHAVCATSHHPPNATHTQVLEIAQTTRTTLTKLFEESAQMITRAELVGVAFQLVLHDVLETDLNDDTHLGGPNGCLSHSPYNAELFAEHSLVRTLFEPLWQRHCQRISRADFWILCAKILLELSDTTHTLRLPFYYGRHDAEDCISREEHALNDANREVSELLRVFVNKLGLSVRDAVALMGGRSVGLHHDARFAWDDTPHIVDNRYFAMLARSTWISISDPLDHKRSLWTPVHEEVSACLGARGQCLLSDRSAHAASISIDDSESMRWTETAMTSLDMALVASRSARQRSLRDRGQETTQCGLTMRVNGTENFHGCVRVIDGRVSEIETENEVKTVFVEQIERFAEHNSLFLWFFASAFERLTTLGYSTSNGLIQQGELGELTLLST